MHHGDTLDTTLVTCDDSCVMMKYLLPAARLNLTIRNRPLLALHLPGSASPRSYMLHNSLFPSGQLSARTYGGGPTARPHWPLGIVVRVTSPYASPGAGCSG